eukprot:TRINITY_DN12935_c0_g1_i1.p1 TRINITY_DN12935_c0_g1~~TRINITY_DN12935_c0_g1_i1.p1  ORF type:complete len:400 (+),score=112.51 TRINITY_DN12935_c0_g1_i1:92-1291(+)
MCIRDRYSNATMEQFDRSGYIRSWNGRYLTSNLLNATTGTPLGSQYTVLHGEASGVSLLTFGFMYNMDLSDGRCQAVSVVPVEETVQSEWFITALTKEGAAADAVLVLAHVDAHDPMLATILQAIRKVLPSKPVQIIAGHSHVRAQVSLDSRAQVFEPGNYFNTIGFSSFDLPTPPSTDPVLFNLQDLDTSKSVLAAAANLTAAALPTPNGTALLQAIKAEEESLGITKVLGCAKQDFLQGPALNALYIDKIVPESFFEPAHNSSQWFVQSTSGLRYSLYKGNVTADDVFKVLPFQDKFFAVRRLTGKTLKALLAALNAQPPPLLIGGEESYYATTDATPEDSAVLDAFWTSFDNPFVTKALNGVLKETGVVAELVSPTLTDTTMMIDWLSKNLGQVCN